MSSSTSREPEIQLFSTDPDDDLVTVVKMEPEDAGYDSEREHSWAPTKMEHEDSLFKTEPGPSAMGPGPLNPLLNPPLGAAGASTTNGGARFIQINSLLCNYKLMHDSQCPNNPLAAVPHQVFVALRFDEQTIKVASRGHGDRGYVERYSFKLDELGASTVTASTYVPEARFFFLSIEEPEQQGIFHMKFDSRAVGKELWLALLKCIETRCNTPNWVSTPVAADLWSLIMSIHIESQPQPALPPQRRLGPPQMSFMALDLPHNPAPLGYGRPHCTHYQPYRVPHPRRASLPLAFPQRVIPHHQPYPFPHSVHQANPIPPPFHPTPNNRVGTTTTTNWTPLGVSTSTYDHQTGFMFSATTLGPGNPIAMANAMIPRGAAGVYGALGAPPQHPPAMQMRIEGPHANLSVSISNNAPGMSLPVEARIAIPGPGRGQLYYDGF